MGFFKNLKEDFSQAMNELLPEDDLLDSDFTDDIENHNEAKRKEQAENEPADKAKESKEVNRDLQEALEKEKTFQDVSLSESAAAREDILTAIGQEKEEESDDDLADFLDMDIFNELLGEEDGFDEEESEAQKEDLTDEDVLNALLSGEDETKESRADTGDDEIISEEDLDLLFSSDDFDSDDLEDMEEEPQEYQAAFQMEDAGDFLDLDTKETDEDILQVQDQLPEDLSLKPTEPQAKPAEDLILDLTETEDKPSQEIMPKAPDLAINNPEAAIQEDFAENSEKAEEIPPQAVPLPEETILPEEMTSIAAENVLKETDGENNMEEEEMDEIFNNGAGSEEEDADLDLIAQLLEEDNSEDVEDVDEEIVARSESEEEPKTEEAASEPRQANEDVTVITKGTKINGSITSDGSLDIMGAINGDIDCLGKLTVVGSVAGNSRAAEVYVNAARVEGGIISTGSVKLGAGTVVIGDVKATSAVVAGAIKGELDIEGPVIIDSTAIVKGNINAKSVQINNGAVVDGYCSLTYAAVDIDNFFDGDK